MSEADRYYAYLNALNKPFRKLAKLEFLQPDNTVAFTLGNGYKRGYQTQFDTRAFLQEGTLNVNLNNGQRRQADIKLANIDEAFDYAVNKIWFGKKVKLSMGLVLPDGTDYYIPQGVFYFSNPQTIYNPSERTSTYTLVDKWAYLDSSLFGTLDFSYVVNAGISTNIFNVISSILRLSRFNYNATNIPEDMIDSTTPIFTTYYNGQTYKSSESDGSISVDYPKTSVPYEITEQTGGNFGNLILSLNEIIAGLIGYDANGALRIEPSQDDINDSDKPILWEFNPANSKLLFGLTEQIKPEEVYNDVLCVGQGLTGYSVWGRATNNDLRSDTNVKLIGRKTMYIDSANYWNAVQCRDLAEWKLKRSTILNKAVTLETAQMFHLSENRLISVVRTDKENAPTERHIIQSYSLPIGETGAMTINCTSVTDIPDFTLSISSGGE